LSNRKSKKLSRIRLADPHLERERAKYEDPLPSREYILDTVTEQGVPLAFERICELLEIAAHEQDAFRRRLGAMAREAQLLQNRAGDWLLPAKADLIQGKVQGHPDGFGFLVRDDGGPDVFLAEREMEKLLHGDRAIVRVVGTDRRGRAEGKVIEVTERANRRLVGRVVEEHGVRFVVAENRRISQDILLAPPEKGKKLPQARSGQVVMVDIIEQPSKTSQPIGRVVEVLGNYADPGMEIEIALRKHDLPFEFSPEALQQTKKLPDEVRKKPTGRAARTSQACRWSPSTAKRHATSTMRSIVSVRARVTGSSSPLPTYRTM
jgi:ribonuclease R